MPRISPIGVQDPGDIQPRCDLLWAKELIVVTWFWHTQYPLCCWLNALIRESSAPNHRVCLESSAIGEAKLRLRVAHCQWLNMAAHDYLPSDTSFVPPTSI